MIIGYSIYGQDLDAYFYKNAPDGIICPECKTCFNYDYAPQNMQVPKLQRFDVVGTYDQRRLFSRRFVDYVTSFIDSNLEFKQVSENPDYFSFLPSRAVEFDIIKRHVIFETPCSLCGGFRSIAGAEPTPLKTNTLPGTGTGFFRTDIPFGGPYKAPMIIVDPKIKTALAQQKFRGILFFPVYSADAPWPPPRKK